jgi:hypothetical protein
VTTTPDPRPVPDRPPAGPVPTTVPDRSPVPGRPAVPGPAGRPDREPADRYPDRDRLPTGPGDGPTTPGPRTVGRRGPDGRGPAPLLSAGLVAVGRGWPVFPVAASKFPWLRAAHAPGHPCRGECGADGHGWRDATLEADRWAGWLSRWPAIPAYGIATEPARLVVVDLDRGKGVAPERVLPDQGDSEPTPDWVVGGWSVLAWIAGRDGAELADLADTFTVVTASGGRHLYYAAPAEVRIRNSVGYTAGRITGLGWCIDVRAAGGYVLGPGSRVRTGPRAWGAYRALIGASIPRPLPGVLQARLAAIGVQRPAQPLPGPGVQPCNNKAGERAGAPRAGGRPRFWAAAVAGELAHIAAAVPHDTAGAGRNATVNRAAYKLGRLVAPLHLSEHDVDQVAAQLHAAAVATGLPEREASAAVASGLAQGRANPRTLTPPSTRVDHRPAVRP